MKKIAKKLSFDRQIIRNLVHVELVAAQGGKDKLTITACGECPPETGACTTGPNSNANHCLTEWSCPTANCP